MDGSTDMGIHHNSSALYKSGLALKQYFPVVLFIMLYKVVLTFESVGEILKCNQSNESS